MKSAPRRVITKTNIHPESYRLTEKTIMSLKLGVIGAGAIGKEHIRRCTQVLQGATVVAVSDINADNARAAAENEPWSSTVRNTCTLSELKAMAV